MIKYNSFYKGTGKVVDIVIKEKKDYNKEDDITYMLYASVIEYKVKNNKYENRN